MQAIESIGNAALELPRRSSPFRALVWKEWRQQRWIYLSLTGLAYVLLLTALIVARSGNFHDDDKNLAAQFLCGCAALLGIVGIVVLSANAFAGEREDNTEQFLATIPCSRRKLFDVKLGFVLFLVLLELIPVGTAALVVGLHKPMVGVGAGETLLALAAGVLVLAIVPALTASFGGSVIATILATAPIAAACCGYMFSPLVLLQFLPVGSKMVKDMLPELFTILMLATILLAARRMWTRVERTWRGSLRTAAATAGLLIVYVLLPSAVAYFYMTCYAPLSFFLSSNNPVAEAYVGEPSPNGKYVICGTAYYGWGTNRSRAALLDVNSGRSQWMTRFYLSEGLPLPRFWSPSGDQFVLVQADEGLWPMASEEANFTYFAVDARSGEKHSFDELWPVMKTLSSIPSWGKLVGWYSDHVFAITDRHDILFADLKSNNVQRCAMPHSLHGAQISHSSWWMPITERGIFSTAEGDRQGGMRVLRFAPELPEAETLVLPGITETARVARASRDGRLLIIRVELAYPGVENYIARLQDGAELTLLESTRREKDGLISASWSAGDFLPGSHQILLHRQTELGLFDADSHDLRRIPLNVEPDVWMISDVGLSPRGGFAMVRLAKATGERLSLVVDLRLGTSWAYDESVRWLGEDHLLSRRMNSTVILNHDGTGVHPLLAN